MTRTIVRWGVAAGLLVWFWHHVDWPALADVVASSRHAWFLVALALFVPQWLIAAARWHAIVAGYVDTSYRRALDSVMAANAANLLLPAKLGDLIKAAYCGVRSGATAVSLPIAERLFDVGLLGAVAAAAACWRLADHAPVLAAVAGSAGPIAAAVCWLRWRRPLAEQLVRVAGPKAGQALRPVIDGSSRVLLWTTALWTLHGVQVWCFFRAAGAAPGLAESLTGIPLLFLAAAVPLAPWGLGSREVVLALLFGRTATQEQLAIVAVMFLLRYLVPGLVGIPAIGRYQGWPRPARGWPERLAHGAG